MFDWRLHCLLSGRLVMISLWIRRAMGRSTLDQIIPSQAICYMLSCSVLDCRFDPFSLSWFSDSQAENMEPLGCITFVFWIVSRLLHQHRLRIDDDSMPETPPSAHGLWLPGGVPVPITPPEIDGQEHLGSNHFMSSYISQFCLRSTLLAQHVPHRGPYLSQLSQSLLWPVLVEYIYIYIYSYIYIYLDR